MKRPRSIGKAFLDDGKNERHQQLLATIAARLDCVRGGMTDTDFAQLVGDVARTSARFAQIDASAYRRALPRSRLSGRATSSRRSEIRPSAQLSDWAFGGSVFGSVGMSAMRSWASDAAELAA